MRRAVIGLVPALAGVGAAGQPFAAYISALTEDSVLKLEDLNGDGDYLDAGESVVFFGPGNASGLPGVGSAQCLLALGYDDLLAGEGEETGPYSTALLRLTDANGDGDAMDAGEARIVWNTLLPLAGAPNVDRMKEILLRPDGSLLIADNNTINFDNDTPEAVWTLADTNGDGDYDDGEVTLFRELSPIGSPFGFITEDFKRRDDGSIVFSNADSSSNTVELWTLSADGATLTPFFDDDDILGIFVKETGMTLSPFTGAPMLFSGDTTGAVGLLEFQDNDGSGDIDPATEIVARYVSSSSSTGIAPDFNSVIDIEVAPDGALWLADLSDDTIYRFEDLNGNGNCQDTVGGVPEVTPIFSPAALGATTAFPRTIAFAIKPGCPADLNGNGVADPGDFTAWVVAYNQGDPAADLNGNGAADPGDFTAWVVAYNTGC
ncbi:MAG: GC-type dockerin domain-anchored protein [Phycisphaerales bacterium]